MLGTRGAPLIGNVKRAVSLSGLKSPLFAKSRIAISSSSPSTPLMKYKRPRPLRSNLLSCRAARQLELSCGPSQSSALLLCGVIFLLVPSSARAKVDFMEIRGIYDIERRGMEMCRASAEVKNEGVVLPANSISFTGMTCNFEQIHLVHQFGYDGGGVENRTVGIGVFGNIGRWKCGRATWNGVRLYFFRPKFSIEFETEGDRAPFEFQRGVLYFILSVIEGQYNSCIYRFSSTFPSNGTGGSGQPPNPQVSGRNNSRIADPPMRAPNTKTGMREACGSGSGLFLALLLELLRLLELQLSPFSNVPGEMLPYLELLSNTVYDFSSLRNIHN